MSDSVDDALRCPSCDAPARSGTRFCTQCGTALPQPEPEPEPESESESEPVGTTEPEPDLEPFVTTEAEPDPKDEAVEAVVDESAASSSCPTCGAAVAGQRFCTECGTRLDGDAAAGVHRSTKGVDDADAAETTLSVPAAHTDDPLVGQTVAFRSLSRRERALRTEPSDRSPILPNYPVGKCVVQAVAGDWVFLAHSSGTAGWCTRAAIRLAGESASSVRATAAPAAATAPGVTPPPVVTRPPTAMPQPVVPPTPTPGAAPLARSDPTAALALIELIERLNLLHASGALNDEEFARAKGTLFDEGTI